MRKCLQTCKDMKLACPINDCKYWVDYATEYKHIEKLIEEGKIKKLSEV